MAISVFDLFSIGIGPSSSHTVGPMRAAGLFLQTLESAGQIEQVETIAVQLFGSLGATGLGHGTDKAVLAGLAGHQAESIDPDVMQTIVESAKQSGQLQLGSQRSIAFDFKKHLKFQTKSLKFHSNGLRFTATDSAKTVLQEKTYFSVGGGFVVNEEAIGEERIVEDTTTVPYPFSTAVELLEQCKSSGFSISKLMMENEKVRLNEKEISERLLEIWRVMQACVRRGCEQEGILPGGLKVKRRAAPLFRKLQAESGENSPMSAMDWVNLWALAVNEENAAGGRIVTAPTNGAAGIIPAVMHYLHTYALKKTDQETSDQATVRFLLTSAAIGILFKKNASISGAEVGCQGEVGSACSMAAAGLTEVMGGTHEQVENAAEIGMEHNLGLTCDPVGGLVQVPCIERNAMASVKAINASRLALRGDGHHFVSLDLSLIHI